MHWLYLACFVLSQDMLRVSAVKRVVEETISIGMSIPHRKSERKERRGGVNTVCVKSLGQTNMRRPTLAESFQKKIKLKIKKIKIHSSTLCSL